MPQGKPGSASSCESIQEVAPGDFGAKIFLFERNLGKHLVTHTHFIDDKTKSKEGQMTGRKLTNGP